MYGIIFLLYSSYLIFNLRGTYASFTHQIIVFSIAIFVLLLIVSYFKLIDKLKLKTQKIINIFIVSFAFAIQIFVFVSSYYQPGWDPYELTVSAINGFETIAYYAAWPNNIFSALFLRIYINITSFLTFFPPLARLTLLNVLFVDTAILFLYLCAKRVFGARQAAKTLFLAILLIGFHPWLGTVYTDTLSMPFPILILYCFVRIYQSKSNKEKYIFSALMAFACVIGSYIKLTVVIMTIAIILAIIFIKKLRLALIFNKKTAFKCLAAFLTSALLFLALANIMQITIKQRIENEYTISISRGMLYFLETGLRSYGTGSWNMETYNWTIDNIQSANYEEMATQRIKELFASYSATDLAKHFYSKLIIAGTDGLFTYAGEGWFYPEEQESQDTLRGFMQNYIYANSYFYRYILTPVFKALWLLTCVLSALSIFSIFTNKNEKEKENSAFNFQDICTFIAKLSIGGLLLFLLIFENRSRYIILYLPVIIFTAQIKLYSLNCNIIKKHAFTKQKTKKL